MSSGKVKGNITTCSAARHGDDDRGRRDVEDVFQRHPRAGRVSPDGRAASIATTGAAAVDLAADAHRRTAGSSRTSRRSTIITDIFRDAGFSPHRGQAAEPGRRSVTLEYCVQYRETTFDFVTRLMEEFGIYYYFTHADGKHTLVGGRPELAHRARQADPVQLQPDRDALGRGPYLGMVLRPRICSPAPTPIRTTTSPRRRPI